MNAGTFGSGASQTEPPSAETPRAPECQHECQLAVDYSMDEHQCNERCMYLDRAAPSGSADASDDLAKALEPFVRHNSSDPFVTITVTSDDIKAARAAIGAFKALAAKLQRKRTKPERKT